QGPAQLPIIHSAAYSTQANAEATLAEHSLAEQQRPFSTKFTQKLKAFAQSQKVTLNTLIQAALGIVLCRYCNTDDVVFGATCAGRPANLEGGMSMVGLFINTLPVRVQLAGETTIAQWLQSLHRQQAATTSYEYVSLRELQAWVNDGNSLFDCLLVFESYPVAANLIQDPDGNNKADITLENVRFDEWTHFPLTLLVGGEERLTVTAKFQDLLLDTNAVSRFLGHLGNVLAALIDNSAKTVRELSLLCASEKKQLASWNQTAVDTFPLEQSVPDLFETQAEKTPDAIALMVNTPPNNHQSLTYQTLNESANQLAHYLQAQGIGPESKVTVAINRSVEMVVALLGILKAGAAYVPLDSSYPPARLDYMRHDAAVELTLSELPSLAAYPTTNPPRTLQPDSSLYVIYTSGSTGQPKGVINTHQALINRLCWMQQTYSLTPEQKVLHKTPLGFDVSFWELFWPLLNGATLVVARPDGHRDSGYLVDLIQSQQISVVHFVPSMLAAFLEHPDARHCQTLQHVICSGEALSVSLQAQFFQQFPNTHLHNLYGPTEAAIDVSAWQCQPGSTSVPIGYPIANTQLHILDNDLNPLPVGVPGELHIAGIGLAKGYLNRPELTAERFIPNPFQSHQSTTTLTSPATERSRSALTSRLYKTGDLARHRPDGAIEYLGRKDTQVKLRGVRIELDEIEATLCAHDEIRQAVAVLREDTPQQPKLVAYLIRSAEDRAENQADSDWQRPLTQFLKQRLPVVMIPSVFVELPVLPLSPNGKLDRKALPPPIQSPQQEKVLPRNATETAIASIWTSVLQQPDISIDDNFFELGGHSLSATRVNTRLRQQFDLDLPLQSLFEYPTLAGLATHIDALKIAAQPAHSQPTPGHKEIDL
ncbi:MAG: amino acid adenylation domain-containing protein, partial [Cyanobacteria bacterium J06643_4]